ncbi:MAG: hypothetical protein D6806_06010, partial [Deltaproteobacteria bacterium]
MPRPNSTFEITTRTVHARFLLKPSRRLNELVLGVIGRALSLYPVRLHLFVVASNHMHMILTAPDIRRVSEFMRYVNSNIAREAGRLYRWREKFWGRRYSSIVILDEQKMLERARYLLSHGCKEGLVLRPGDWPGVNCVGALTRGKKLRGVWYDRSLQYEAERAGRKEPEASYATSYDVELSPLPCLEHLEEAQRRAVFRGMVREIELETRKMQRGGRRVAGRKVVLSQRPHDRPEKPARRPRPL